MELGKEFFKGFDPFLPNGARLLVLGSFPSVKSRENGFYYGNKQNRFFKTLYNFFEEPLSFSVDDRKEFLKRHKIGLYDVFCRSVVRGSGDKDFNFESAKISPVKEIILGLNNLELIICNGKKAYEIFSFIFPDCPIKYIYLPSTSSANPKFSEKLWFDALRFLK